MSTLILQGTNFQPTQQQEAEAVDYALNLFRQNDLTLDRIECEWQSGAALSELIDGLWNLAENNAMRVCGTDRVSLVIV